MAAVDDRPQLRVTRDTGRTRPDTGLTPLWRAIAAAELGRSAEALALLATLDPTEPAIRQRLRHLLRAQPARFLPLLREAFGPRHAELLREALAPATRMHLDADLQRVWLDQAADIGILPTDNPTQIDTKAELLTMRAAAWQAIGDLEQAAADLDAAAALRLGAAEGPDDRLAELDYRRTQIAAARGRPEEALAAVARALARSSTPGFMTERLRMDPQLQPMEADPRWRRLLATRP